MKQNVTAYAFRDAFLKSDTYKDNFSYEGLKALFEWFEEYERDVNDGEEINFDMVAIACEYSEYESALECAKEYGFTPSYKADTHEAEPSEEEQEKEALEWLEDRTQVVPFEKGIIIAQF
jgi:hypothetical protein